MKERSVNRKRLKKPINYQDLDLIAFSFEKSYINSFYLHVKFLCKILCHIAFRMRHRFFEISALLFLIPLSVNQIRHLNVIHISKSTISIAQTNVDVKCVIDKNAMLHMK